MSPLSIAFFGSSLVSAYWNGAATYYRGILAALARRGHRITFYEPDAYDRQKNRDIPDPDWARVVVYDAAEDAVLRCLDEARGADLLVKASGVGVFDALLEQAVLDIRRRGVMAAFWDVDAPATLDRVIGDPGDPFRRLIPRYDAILTYGGAAIRSWRPIAPSARGAVCRSIMASIRPRTIAWRPIRGSPAIWGCSPTGCPTARRGSRPSSSMSPLRCPSEALCSAAAAGETRPCRPMSGGWATSIRAIITPSTPRRGRF